MGIYISEKSLKNLDSYAYKSIDKYVFLFFSFPVMLNIVRSILSKYVLNPYWNQLVKLWPKWVAPNTVSSLRLIVLVELNPIVFYTDNIHRLITCTH